MARQNTDKWTQYYSIANENNSDPPWESPLPFAGLQQLTVDKPNIVSPGMRCIELGCGCSASAVFLAELGLDCTAVDICPLAIERAKSKLSQSSMVNWMVSDIFDDNFSAQVGEFDFVFDMQCFHVLRDIDEVRASVVIFNLLKPGGYAMVVTGARTSDEEPLNPGPPMLSKEQLLNPFLSLGLELIEISMSRFNSTVAYLQPPRCWVSLFRKNTTIEVRK